MRRGYCRITSVVVTQALCELELLSKEFHRRRFDSRPSMTYVLSSDRPPYPRDPKIPSPLHPSIRRHPR